MNKKIFSLLILLITTVACATSPSLNHIPKKTEIVGFDFSKYSEKGFLITPGEYGENYEAIGLLKFRIYPESNEVESIKEHRYDWEIEEINSEEVIELAYQEAIKRDANAITHFKTKYVDLEGFEVIRLKNNNKGCLMPRYDEEYIFIRVIPYVNVITVVSEMFVGIEVEGLLIKRK